MKKLLGFCSTVMVLFILGACGGSISKEDLMEHPWSMETKSVDGEKSLFQVEFSKSNMNMKVDTGSNDDEYDEDSLFGGLADAISELAKMSYSYELNGKQLKLYSDQMDHEVELELTKDGDNIKLKEIKSNQDNKSGFDGALLIPEKKSKDPDEKETKDSSTEETTELESTELETAEESEEEFEETEEIESSIETPVISDKIDGAVLENDSVKITLTGIDFLGNVDSVQKDVYDSNGYAVIYYTFENTGSENIEPLTAITDYLNLTEEDDVSADELSPSFSLYNYPTFAKLDEQSRLNIKPGAKIEGAIDYGFSSTDKKINVTLFDSSIDYEPTETNTIASKTFSPEDIAKSFKKNNKIKPD